jgi:hypothetical protein
MALAIQLPHRRAEARIQVATSRDAVKTQRAQALEGAAHFVFTQAKGLAHLGARVVQQQRQTVHYHVILQHHTAGEQQFINLHLMMIFSKSSTYAGSCVFPGNSATAR